MTFSHARPRLSTLIKWAFDRELHLFEHNDPSFRFPDTARIRAYCAHFLHVADVDDFCDLVAKLYRGPQAPQKAVGFAEHLVRMHNFSSLCVLKDLHLKQAQPLLYFMMF